MENYDIGVILRKSREALGYSRNEVCCLCEEQFSEKTLYRLEKGYVKANDDIINRLSKLYNKPIRKLYTTIDMNRYSMLRIYSEIIDYIFHNNFVEAEYKLKLFENYVQEDSDNKIIINWLNIMINHYKWSSSTNQHSEIAFIMEELFYEIVPKQAEITIYPLTDIMLHMYFVYIDSLKKAGYYKETIFLTEKLLSNIMNQYHNETIFCDYYGVLNAQLALMYKMENQHRKAMEIAKEAVQKMIYMGDLSNIYHLVYIYVKSAEEMNFFEDGSIKQECIEFLKKIHSICIACNMPQKALKIEKHLRKNYEVSVV